MNKWKLFFIVIIFMMACLIYHTCTLEGLDDSESPKPTVTKPTVTKPTVTKPLSNNITQQHYLHQYNIIPSKTCVDDSTWYVTDKSGKKNYCSDIGTTASCYDFDSIGREGWERCLKSCGNCANTQVTKLPMNVMATFSGDPIEDFGVVLHIDKDRKWVGNQGRGAYVDKSKDIDNLYDQVDSLEDMFDLITGNINTCKTKDLKKCGNKKFQGCKQCLNCPTGGIPTPTEKHTYIKTTCSDDDKDDCSIQFPAVEYKCSTIPTSWKINVNPKPTYIGCYADNKGKHGHTDMFRALSGKHYKLTEKEQKMSLDGRRDACNRECQGFKYMGLQSKDDCFCGDRYEYFEDKNVRKERQGGDKSDKEDDWKTFTPDKQTGKYNDEESTTMCGGKGTKTCGNSNDEEGGCCAHGGQNGNTCDWSNAVFKVATNITDKCKNYYLFDKIIDNDDDDKDKVGKDAKLNVGKKTLYDMCPKQCGVTTDECPN